MSTINPLNNYKGLSNGMSGLISGLDTDSMVEKLLAGTQSKIDKQSGAKQQLEWKQDSYREVISMLSGFQDKFLNFLSPTTNIMSNAFFNDMAATSGNPAVKVTATTNANAGSIKINQVLNLAKAQKHEGNSTISKELVGSIDLGIMGHEGEKLVDITLDGIKKTIVISGSTNEQVRASFAEGLRAAFGSENIKVEGTDDEIKLTVKSGSQVSVSATVVGGEQKTDGRDALGFGQHQSNKVNASASLSNLSLQRPLVGEIFKFEINGKTIETQASDSIKSIIEKVNTSGAGVNLSYSSISDKFTIEATESGAGREISLKDVDGNFLQSMFGSDNIASLVETTKGENAKLIMADGSLIERSSNTFELDGINIELIKTTDVPIEINTAKNTDQIFNGIKSFVEEYNSMIDKLTDMVGQDASYKKYPPLTSAQKKEMSESEIKNWDQKSKEGLLRNDSIINGILSNMRSAMYQKPDDAKLAIYDLGITTGDWRGNGKLVINDEAALKKLIATNGDDIEKLFTDPAKGLGAGINKIIDGAAKKSSAAPGSLVQMAGIKGWVSGVSSTLSRQMTGIDDVVTILKRNYEAEKSRYWKQFSAMENVINKMNQQSSWLSSQLG